MDAMATSTASGSPVTNKTSTLNIKILSQLPDPHKVVMFDHVDSSRTVLDLKNMIRDCLPQRPPSSSQRLIYRGHVLAREQDTLGTIFAKDTSPAQQDIVHVLHVVIRELDLNRDSQSSRRIATPLQPRPFIQLPSVIPQNMPTNIQPTQLGAQHPAALSSSQRPLNDPTGATVISPLANHQSQLPAQMQQQAGVFHASPFVTNPLFPAHPAMQQPNPMLQPQQPNSAPLQASSTGQPAPNTHAGGSVPTNPPHVHGAAPWPTPTQHAEALDRLAAQRRAMTEQMLNSLQPMAGQPGQQPSGPLPHFPNNSNAPQNGNSNSPGPDTSSLSQGQVPRPAFTQGMTPQGVHWTTTFHTTMPLNGMPFNGFARAPFPMFPNLAPHRQPNPPANISLRGGATNPGPGQEPGISTSSTDAPQSTSATHNPANRTDSTPNPSTGSSGTQPSEPREASSAQRQSNDGEVTAYVLYSPEGPRALLITPEGRYESVPPVPLNMPPGPLQQTLMPYPNPYYNVAQFPSMQRQYSRMDAGAGTTNLANGSTTMPTQPDMPNQPTNTITQQGQPQQQQNQLPQQDPPVQAQLQQLREENQADDLAQAVRPAFRAIWALVRIFGFIWFFTSGSSSRRMVLLVIASLCFWATQAGVFGDRLERLRQYWEELIGLPPGNNNNNANGAEAAQANNPNNNNNNNYNNNNGNNADNAGDNGRRRNRDPEERENRRLRRRLERGQLEPREAANRLLNVRQEADRGWFRERTRPAERALALFLASLYPGVGERHVATRERLDREAAAAAAQAHADAEAEAAAARSQEAQPEAVVADADNTAAGAGAGAGAGVGGVLEHGQRHDSELLGPETEKAVLRDTKAASSDVDDANDGQASSTRLDKVSAASSSAVAVHENAEDQAAGVRRRQVVAVDHADNKREEDEDEEGDQNDAS